VIDEDAELRSLLEPLDPKREHLRNVLIRDQADRDAISSRLMRYRDQNGQDWSDIIDFLTMYPDTRRRIVRLLGEIEAGEHFLTLATSKGLVVKGSHVRLVGWLMVFAALFALRFNVRVMGSASEATAASGLVGVVVSLIILAIGSFLVVRFRTS
jgi:hypothetical protein